MDVNEANCAFDPAEASEGEWPPLTLLGEGTVFPEWLQAAAGQIVDAFGKDLKSIEGNFWGNSYYDDNNNVEAKSELNPTWNDPSNAPDEEDQDKIPAMRKIMRLGIHLHDEVPLEVDDEGSLSGEVCYSISRKGFDYVWTDWNDRPVMNACARWDGKIWEYHEVVWLEDHLLSETQKLILDMDMIKDEYPATNHGFKEWMEPLRIEQFDEEHDDHGFIALVFPRGQLALYEESNR